MSTRTHVGVCRRPQDVIMNQREWKPASHRRGVERAAIALLCSGRGGRRRGDHRLYLCDLCLRPCLRPKAGHASVWDDGESDCRRDRLHRGRTHVVDISPTRAARRLPVTNTFTTLSAPLRSSKRVITAVGVAAVQPDPAGIRPLGRREGAPPAGDGGPVLLEAEDDPRTPGGSGCTEVVRRR